jgi:hypothetical protein
MSNHGEGPFPGFDPERPEFAKRRDLMRQLLNTTGFRGALGEFPQGQLSKDDEGAVIFAIGEKDGKVVVDFGKPVHWLGMTPQQAADFASTLLKRARAVGRANGETITFTLR